MTFPTILLIVFREALEALLIVATLLTAIRKLSLVKLNRPVYLATGLALGLSLGLLIINSLLGNYLQAWYLKNEEYVEAFLAITSAIFITWAALFLHETFVSSKVTLLSKINSQLDGGRRGVFLLAFTAVFREGIEVVFFLSSLYLTSTLGEILAGVLGGIALSSATLLLIFRSVLKVSLGTIFRFTTLLLILFAGGLLAKGVHELSEIGYIPNLYQVTLPLIPANNFVSEIIKALFGITKAMDLVQIGVYLTYVIYLTKHLVLNQYDNPKEEQTTRKPTASRA